MSSEISVAPRILLIEDFEKFRLFVTDLLEKQLGARVFTCQNGDQALKALRAEDATIDPYMVVILDRFIPRCPGELDSDLGISLLSAHQLLRPGTPVIVLTGHATFQDCVEAIKAGAYEYIDKNDSERDCFNTLIATCRKVLGIEKDPFADWVQQNGRTLREKFGGKYVCLLPPEIATQAGLSLPEVGGEAILANSNLQTIRTRMLDNPELRWIVPRIIRIPRSSD